MTDFLWHAMLDLFRRLFERLRRLPKWALRGLPMGLFACVALVACHPIPVPPLKVGVNSWVGYDPLVLARDKGLMNEQQIKLIELSSSTETLRNFRNGLLDAAALTLDETLRLADEGLDLKIVAVLDASAGGDLVVASEAVPGLADLRGKTIAVERTTVGALVLQRLLETAGLQESDVVVQHMEAGQHLEALRSQRVDVSVTYETLAGPIRDAGFRTIFDSRQMPGDIVDVLVVRSAALDQRSEQVEHLLAGWQGGLSAMEQDPKGSAQLLSQGLSMDPKDYLAALNGLIFYSGERSRALLAEGAQTPSLGKASEHLVATLMRLGLIQKEPDWGDLIWVLAAPAPASGAGQ